ncbi:maleylpyruvate isomerase N-terminal domain-containing protein [Microbacterium sp. A196]|uniref:maleylpyruvate isomerase N-terminal domain-containing protein n=1 Tax=Microbacterium sp. A196 TaxID=3457320 RepID=UPI003FD42B61
MGDARIPTVSGTHLSHDALVAEQAEGSSYELRSLAPDQIELRNRLGAGARYDSDRAPREALTLARRGTAYFLRKLQELSDAELDDESAIPGRSRRYVVAEVGYQARWMAEAVEAVRVQSTAPQISEAGHRAQLERGESLPSRALRYLAWHATTHLNVEWRDLGDDDWDREIEVSGRTMNFRDSVWGRAELIWQRAIDLRNGGLWRDVPPEVRTRIAPELLHER